MLNQFQAVHCMRSFMNRINSCFLSAYTKIAVTFSGKNKHLPNFPKGTTCLSLLSSPTTVLEHWISRYIFIKCNSGGILYAQADLNMVTHSNFGRFSELSGVLNVCQRVKSYFI